MLRLPSSNAPRSHSRILTPPILLLPPVSILQRFHAFRYSLPSTSPALHPYLLSLAQSNSCFGWSQTTATSTVGEYRCPKPTGPKVQTAVENGPYPPEAGMEAGGGRKATVKVYEDAKIKLHFSRFKQLPEGRVTCFRDEPHR